MEISGANRWDAFMSHHSCKDKQLLENSIYNLILQISTYLYEVYKAYVSLIVIYDALSVFNLPSSLVDQVTLLVGDRVRKDKALVYA